MKIYRLKTVLDEYISIQMCNKDSGYLKEFRNRIRSGELQGNLWDNTPVEIIEGEQTADLIKFWSAPEAIVLSEEGKYKLEKILNGFVEYIPLKLGNEILYLVNILCIIDAIDYSRASFRSLETGLVVGMDKYAFQEDKVTNCSLFRVKLNGRIYSTETYVSSLFKERVEENQLTGFEFVEVWDPEKP